NRRYKFLLAQGTAGLSVAVDLPTQIGYDSDDPMALGEVGKVGVAIDSIEDMERLFDGIRLDHISTSMTINATASILLALYVAVARRTGANVKKLSGTVQNDILKEYIARGMRCALSPTCSRGRARKCRSGTRFQSPAITCARRDRPRRRKWLSRWRMEWPTCRLRSTPGSMWTSSPRGSPSSSTPIAIFSRRLRSFAPRGGSGQASCGTTSRRRIRAR